MVADSPKFLITGATGFVGGRLMQALADAYGAASVTGLTYTSGRDSEIQKLRQFREQGFKLLESDLLKLSDSSMPRPEFDVLYHLAGVTESENPHAPFEVNSLGTLNLLEWLGPRLKGKRVIFAGTIAAVDATNPLHPITEETPCAPKTAYGRSKLEGENFIKTRASTLGYSYTIPRLCTIVGPGYRPGGMFNIFPKMLSRQALATRLNWPGRSSYLSVSDLTKILVALPQYPQATNETYVLDNGEGPSFDVVLEQIASELNLPRKHIRLPAFCWGFMLSIAAAVAATRTAPFRLHNTCWRVSHMIGNGLLADSSKITRLTGMKYQSLADALKMTYDSEHK